MVRLQVVLSFGGYASYAPRNRENLTGRTRPARWFVVMVIRAAWMRGVKIHLTAFLALTSVLFTCSSSMSAAPAQSMRFLVSPPALVLSRAIDLLVWPALLPLLLLPCSLGQTRVSMSMSCVTVWHHLHAPPCRGQHLLNACHKFTADHIQLFLWNAGPHLVVCSASAAVIYVNHVAWQLIHE